MITTVGSVVDSGEDLVAIKLEISGIWRLWRCCSAGSPATSAVSTFRPVHVDASHLDPWVAG